MHRHDESADPLSRRPQRGRGAVSNRSGRFERTTRTPFDDGWDSLQSVDACKTHIHLEKARRIINKVNSPDISFDRSINAYRGCEHGCIYCFARPSHSYLGFSAGLDFETQLIVKENAPALLREELSRPGYQARTIALGSNTDPYQPIERHYHITRQILQLMLETRHPVAIVTKSARVLRDLDLLQPLARLGLVRVALSVTTLDRRLARKMEPRASTPARRLAALRELADAGIPTVVMMAPIIPALNDCEIERILQAAARAGAHSAGYILLRLPGEVAELFTQWLHVHYPDRAGHVLSLMREMHEGRLYRANWGERMRGRGVYARLIQQRFHLAARKYGLMREKKQLHSDLFRPPAACRPKASASGTQLDLFERL